MPLADGVDIERRAVGPNRLDISCWRAEAAMAQPSAISLTGQTDRLPEWNRNPTVRNRFDAALASVRPSAMRSTSPKSPTRQTTPGRR